MKGNYNFGRRSWSSKQFSKVCFGDASVYGTLRVKPGCVSLEAVIRLFAWFELIRLRVSGER